MKLILFFVLAVALFFTVYGGDFFFVVFMPLSYLVWATIFRLMQGFSWRNEVPNTFRVFLVSLGVFTHQFSFFLAMPLVLAGFLLNDEALRRVYRHKGVIVLSGIDATGKSTMCHHIASWLRTKGIKCEIIAFPQYLFLEKLSSLIRKGGKTTHPRRAYARTSKLSTFRPYLAVVDKWLLYILKILPRIAIGDYVVCDRFVWDNYVKHKALGYPTRFLFWLATLIKPRSVFILDVSAETSINRVKKKRGHLVYAIGEVEAERKEFIQIANVFGYPIVNTEVPEGQTWRVLKTTLERTL